MLDQTMSAQAAQKRILHHAQTYGHYISREQWTLDFAKSVLRAPRKALPPLNLYQTAGLALAIICFTQDASDPDSDAIF